jgi:hypothetical protein
LGEEFFNIDGLTWDVVFIHYDWWGTLAGL